MLLWIHRLDGCSFLIPFCERATVIEMARELVAMETTDDVLDEEEVSRCMNFQTEIPEEGICFGGLPYMQFIMAEDGYVPEKKYYDVIAYACFDDAYEMILHNKAPMEYFDVHHTFLIVERVEPYDFTQLKPRKAKDD